MTGERYRMVHIQNGTEHVSSVVMAEDEIEEHLDWLERIHEDAGWSPVARIYRIPGVMDSDEIWCWRSEKFRRIFARLYSPLEDV